MRLVVSQPWENGGHYAPRCLSTMGRKEGSMRLMSLNLRKESSMRLMPLNLRREDYAQRCLASLG